MGFTTGSRWAQFIGWLIVGLYVLGFLFWLGVGIYVAADTPSNLEHILFSGLSLFALTSLVMFLLRLFASGDDWWENGTPSFVYVLGFWILSAAALLINLFVLLRSILDNQFNNSSDEMLLQALDGTLLGIATISFIYQFAVGVMILLINRPAITLVAKHAARRAPGIGRMSRTTTRTVNVTPANMRFR